MTQVFGIALVVLMTTTVGQCMTDDVKSPPHPSHEAVTPPTHSSIEKREVVFENKEPEVKPAFVPEFMGSDEVEDLNPAESYLWKHWGLKNGFRYPYNYYNQYPLMYGRPPFPIYPYYKKW